MGIWKTKKGMPDINIMKIRTAICSEQVDARKKEFEYSSTAVRWKSKNFRSTTVE